MPLFEKFFAAENPADAAAVADQLVAAGVDFDTALRAAEEGPHLCRREARRVCAALEVEVGPLLQQPRRRPVGLRSGHQVAVARAVARRRRAAIAEPHSAPGATAGRPQPGQPARTGNRIEGEKQIYLHPSGWAAAQWWDEEQIDNILRAVDALKRKYNIDESRIYITGISDGGTGVYYMALKEPNLWSSYLPLNGSIAVIRAPQNGADGEMYGNNLINAPLYIVNGELDNLYPVEQVEPHIKWLQSMGVPFVFRPQPGAEHNTAWWPTERAPYETVRPRASASRASGEAVVGDRARRQVQSQPLAGDQRAAPRCLARNGTERPRLLPAYQAVWPCGCDSQPGNTFDAKVRDVAAFTLLLSPDAIDFSKPVIVTVNGKPAFSGTVKKDPATLLRWAARDNDRTALYGAELKIAVP